MLHRFASFAIPFALAVALGACGGDAKPEMTKAQMLKDLAAVVADLKAENFGAIVGRFVLPEDVTKEQAIERLSGHLKSELSEAGLAVLVANAKFGPLTELFPERGAKWAERAKVAAAECYALAHGSAEVVSHWTGSKFMYVRLNNVVVPEVVKPEVVAPK